MFSTSDDEDILALAFNPQSRSSLSKAPFHKSGVQVINNAFQMCVRAHKFQMDVCLHTQVVQQVKVFICIEKDIVNIITQTG